MARLALNSLGIGLASIVLGAGGSPRDWSLGTYWLCLLLASAALTGYVIRSGGRRAGARIGAEAVAACVALGTLWPVVVPRPRSTPPPGTVPTNSVSWRAGFTADDQALRKGLPVPPGAQGHDVFLRVDLGTDYKGTAGFRVQVNDHDLGILSTQGTDSDYEPVAAGPSWGVRLPPEVLREPSPLVVTLRPIAGLIDPQLTVAGHGDPRVDPLGPGNSAFFDGREWRADRLAGIGAGTAKGMYRMFLTVGGVAVERPAPPAAAAGGTIHG